MSAMNEHIAKVLEPGIDSLQKSWRWIRDEFADEFHAMWGGKELEEHGGSEKIWQTRVKFVLKVKSPRGRWIAYKAYRILPRFSCLFHGSAVVSEAYNYRRLEALGIPMVKILAVGECRNCFRISGAFLMTEFANGFQDGRCFAAKGDRRHETALRDEFFRRHLAYLALLHDAGYIHGGVTPANLLWRELEQPAEDGRRIDVLWLDVATCRKVSSWRMKRLLAYDFGNLFRFLDLTEEERIALLRGYYEQCKIRRMPFDELCARVKKATAERLRKHGC